MKLTITDIAEIAGVSVATVSRVINNKSKGVSDATRKRIWAIIEEHNFQPSAVARGLVTKSSNIIGLIIPDITNPFYPILAKGVEDAASERGYNTILCDGGNLPEKEAAHLDFLNEHYVSGIIYNNFREISDETLNLINGSYLPTIFVDSKVDTQYSKNVYIDNLKAVKEAMFYLYEQGHRKIAFLRGPKDSHSSIMRYKGYKAALRALNLPLDEHLVVTGNYELEDASQAVATLLDRNCEFTALFCCNDLMALGAYDVFENRNIQIPEDISIVGFDDILLSRLIKPKLTTVHQPSYEMGLASANLLIDTLEGKNDQTKIVFDTELVIRDSVKDINS